MSEIQPPIIDFKKQNPSQLLLQRPPILSTYEAGWNGFLFEYHCQGAGETEEVCIINGHAILIFTTQHQQIKSRRKLDGQLRDDPVQAGDVIIIPQGIGHGVRAYGEAEFIVLVITPEIFAHSIEIESQLIPSFANSDALLYQIGLAMKATLESDLSGSRLYAETMVNAVAVHLIQGYGSRQATLHNCEAGLTPNQLKKVIEYIRTHLDQDLSLNELSALTHISPHYFSQLFKQATGMTPHKYVISCRVAEAKELLRKGNLSIAEVAQQVGFANQSHLNLHIKRQLGVTPKQILQHR
jgi:AraC family transcriptional regulator